MPEPVYVFGLAIYVLLFLVKETPREEREANRRMMAPGARSPGQIPTLMLVILTLQSLVLESVSFSVPVSASVEWGPCHLPLEGCEGSVSQDVLTFRALPPAQVWDAALLGGTGAHAHRHWVSGSPTEVLRIWGSARRGLQEQRAPRSQGLLGLSADYMLPRLHFTHSLSLPSALLVGPVLGQGTVFCLQGVAPDILVVLGENREGLSCVLSQEGCQKKDRLPN